MRLSINWLKDFVDLTVAPAALADRLTLAGLEVEALEDVTPDFSGVVVGRVTRVEPHPQADRLRYSNVKDHVPQRTGRRRQKSTVPRSREGSQG